MYEQCKELIVEKMKNDKNFLDAFSKSVSSYADRHGTSLKNGEQYILEEISWIFSLPLVHLNKNIYLVHVGNDNPVIKEMFRIFSNLNKAVKWLSLRLKELIFKNEADFLMYCNANRRHTGYSYAFKNKDIVTKASLKKISHSPLGFESPEKTILQHIIEKLPCHIYWLNRDNVYLGCNMEQAKDFGLKSTDEVIGKTNFDFHDYDTAVKLNKVNELVMSTGKAYEGEEPAWIEENTANCLSTKAPLFDIQGKIIGLLGVSLDITDRKKAEELEKQKELYEIAKGVAHDICSPLSALEIVKNMSLDKLSPEEKKMFELSIRSIREISDSLIKRYRKEEEIEGRNSKYIEVYLEIKDIVERKKYENQGKGVKIRYYPDERNKYVFIKGNEVDFSRMMNNLLNNAEESIDKRKGEVNIEVSYEVIGEEVEVKVKDNGGGMRKDMVEKINRGMAVGTTKKEGHGIGMEEIMRVVKELGGKMEVKSKEGEGTEFVLEFGKSEKPKWLADKIKLHKGDMVVVLDDDILVHEIWKKKFKENEGDIEVKYFTKGEEAINFINSLEEKSKAFLLADYELKGEGINGIEVIEKSNMLERHVLVTNKYFGDIKDFKEKIEFIKIFHKMYLNEFNIVVV